MPFYEYECPACKYYAEVLQKISDKPLKQCPSCRKAGFKRLVSAPVFRLKGSGWYETDFKSDGDNKRNLAGAEREEAKPAADDKGVAAADAKVSAEAGKAAGETSKPATAAAPQAAPAGSAGKPGGESASRSSAKRSAKRVAKPAAKRAAVRPARKAARGGRRR
jgi:putative FmdB family regulatory protein